MVPIVTTRAPRGQRVGILVTFFRLLSGPDGTIYLGESERRSHLFFYTS